jgi:hypothetical protein
MAKAATTKNVAWDDESNEATNNFITWGEVGDYILGALVSAKQVPSTLPDKQGEMQWVYEVKVRDAQWHVLDEKKRVVDEPVIAQEGDIVSVGGRKTIDSRMARIKIGQIVGLKFVEELPAKTRGYNPTKLIKVFTPKGRDGEFEFDLEIVNANNVANFDKADDE